MMWNIVWNCTQYSNIAFTFFVRNNRVLAFRDFDKCNCLVLSIIHTVATFRRTEVQARRRDDFLERCIFSVKNEHFANFWSCSTHNDNICLIKDSNAGVQTSNRILIALKVIDYFPLGSLLFNSPSLYRKYVFIKVISKEDVEIFSQGAATVISSWSI